MPAPPFPRQTFRGLVTVNFHLCSRDRQSWGKEKDWPFQRRRAGELFSDLRSPESPTRKNGPLPSSALRGGEPRLLLGIATMLRIREACAGLRTSPCVASCWSRHHTLQISFASLCQESLELCGPVRPPFESPSARVNAKSIPSTFHCVLASGSARRHAVSALRDSRLQCHCEWNSLKDVVGLPRIAGPSRVTW